MLKRVTALSLAAILSVSLFTACGAASGSGTEPASEPVSYTPLDVYKRQGYITSVFLGIEDSEDQEAKPDMDLICQLIRKYYRVANNGIAYSVLSAIKKNAAWDWPEDIYDAVRYLALQYPQIEDAALATRETEEESKSLERLKIEALNCTRGHALYTLAALLVKHPSQIDFCKTVALKASRDDNEAVRLSIIHI